MSRGITNANPGNIRLSADKWQGLADKQTDADFFQFKDASWGIRAMAVILIGYYDRDGLDTVSGIISKWAPPSENDTAAYIKDVCRDTIFTADKKLNLHQYGDIAPLVKAIIHHENGEQPYSDDVINQGLARAGIEIPKRPLYGTTVIKGIATTVVAQATDTGTTLLSNTPSLAQYAPDNHWVHKICFCLTGLGIGLTMIGHFRDNKKSITGGAS